MSFDFFELTLYRRDWLKRRRTGSGVVSDAKASFLLGSDEYIDLRETVATEGSELRLEVAKEDRELEAIQRAVGIVSRDLSQ